ncbi:pectate lyase [Paenibacillus harenae]|nr:pectate lyase [Paenibacillus harenae]
MLATSSGFDKNSANRADIDVLVKSNGYALTNITNGTTILEPSDYTVTGSVYTIHKDFLGGLTEGSTLLGFDFGSITIPLTISVKDTSGSDIGKQVLAPNDGWGSHTTGTTGGAAAAPENIHTVTKRSELIHALGNLSAAPKIVYIEGTIDMNVDADDNPVGMEYYQDPAYDFDAYLAAYDPEVWGRTSVPSGPLETARAKSENNQGNNIKINVGSNTTIVGLPGSQAKIVGGSLNLQNADNVIIRNIEFQNTFDYFPQWDPTDGDSGNWNSAFDAVSIKGSAHVWFDHNTINDIGGLDDPDDQYFGRKYQQHDGALDITNGSDLITVSYNYFHDHDKTTLVGGSDSFTGDAGKERITFHHNYYQNAGQRAPRVRFGQVHLYNNYYEGTTTHPTNPFGYAIGVGFESQVYAQNNYFANDAGLSPSSLIQVLGGTAFTDEGTMLNGENVDISESYGTLQSVNWTPALYTSMDRTVDVPAIVIAQAGAERTQSGDIYAPIWNAGNLTATDVNKTGMTLTWTAATDNIGVTGYNIYKAADGTYTEIASLGNVTTYKVTGLSKDTGYTFVIRAVDAAGNWSADGPGATVKTDHDNRDNNPGKEKRE